MTALLRKDWRVYRPAITGAVVVTMGVYAIGVPPIVYQSGVTAAERVRQFLYVALLASATTGIFAAALGASSFAVERRDGAAEFLAMLPVSRGRILLSKALVALTFVLLAFGTHIIFVSLALRYLGWRNATESFYALAGIGTGTLMLFSIAWFFSAVLSGAAIPFGISVAVTVASAAILSQVIDAMGQEGYAFVHVWLVLSGVLAMACGVAGSILYSRRVSP